MSPFGCNRFEMVFDNEDGTKALLAFTGTLTEHADGDAPLEEYAAPARYELTIDSDGGEIRFSDMRPAERVDPGDYVITKDGLFPR